MRILNRRAIIREYLLNLSQDILMSTTIEAIIILSSTINQLTDTRFEWTRAALVIISSLSIQLFILRSLEYCRKNLCTVVKSSL